MVVAPGGGDDGASSDDGASDGDDAPLAVRAVLQRKRAEARRRRYAVDWHRDATLGLRQGAVDRPPLARRVSVLYVAAPDADGGALELRLPERPAWRTITNGRRIVDKRVSPKANRLVVFRGDAEHAVRGVGDVRAADSAFPRGERVSVVLEQRPPASKSRRGGARFG